jgi:thiosulfate dehydrogenase
MVGKMKIACIVVACAAFVWIWMAVGSVHSENTNPKAAEKKMQGQEMADALMDQWKRQHPNRDWVVEEKSRHTIVPPADNSDLLKGKQSKGNVYGNITELDLITWNRELEKMVVQGSLVFHDAERLGSTISVSCDMCHPDAANTHPETYPKFQVQMGRVVLLRDMINWCIEQAVRGEVLSTDDPNMRALEAYIIAQRKGVRMNYGRR